MKSITQHINEAKAENDEDTLNICIYRDRNGKLVKMLPSTSNYEDTKNMLKENAPATAISWFVLPKVDKDLSSKKYVSKFMRIYNDQRKYDRTFANTDFLDNEKTAITILNKIF